MSIHRAFHINHDQYKELMATSGRDAIECMGRYRKQKKEKRKMHKERRSDEDGVPGGDAQERNEMGREDKERHQDGGAVTEGTGEHKETDAKDAKEDAKDAKEEKEEEEEEDDVIESFYNFAFHQRLKERYEKESMDEIGRVPTRVEDLVEVLEKGSRKCRGGG